MSASLIERGRADPSLIPHGTPGGWTNWGCRCDQCREARKASLQRYAEAHRDEIRRKQSEYDKKSWAASRPVRCPDCDGEWSIRTDGRRYCPPCSHARSVCPQVPEHGTRARYDRGCRCEPCKQALMASVDVERQRAYAASIQAQTMERADRRGREWSGPELELAARDDLTAKEVALILHRTAYAVKTMRHRLRSVDPRDRMLADGPPPTSRSGPR